MAISAWGRFLVFSGWRGRGRPLEVLQLLQWEAVRRRFMVEYGRKKDTNRLWGTNFQSADSTWTCWESANVGSPVFWGLGKTIYR